MVNGSWDMTSPLIEMVRPISDITFVDSFDANTIGKKRSLDCWRLLGQEWRSISALDPKRRTESGVRLRIGAHRPDNQGCVPVDSAPQGRCAKLRESLCDPADCYPSVPPQPRF